MPPITQPFWEDYWSNRRNFSRNWGLPASKRGSLQASHGSFSPSGLSVKVSLGTELPSVFSEPPPERIKARCMCAVPKAIFHLKSENGFITNVRHKLKLNWFLAYFKRGWSNNENKKLSAKEKSEDLTPRVLRKTQPRKAHTHYDCRCIIRRKSGLKPQE